MLLAKKDAAGEIFSQLEVGGRSDLDNHRNVGGTCSAICIGMCV